LLNWLINWLVNVQRFFIFDIYNIIMFSGLLNFILDDIATNHRNQERNTADDEDGLCPVVFFRFWEWLSFHFVKFSSHAELLTHLFKVHRLVNGRVGRLSNCQLFVVWSDHFWGAGKLDFDIFGGVEVDWVISVTDCMLSWDKFKHGKRIQFFATRVGKDIVDKFIKLEDLFDCFICVFEFLSKHKTRQLSLKFTCEEIFKLICLLHTFLNVKSFW